ncbi:EF-P 5-aminopentanol modification-associated protein YfmF [Priestia taiwanensis]|uniref:Peptidase M16 n=1 Tax=Priestia taiwanensis TaxID=1347902 RepID=A0A917APQ0_9BACI|nr:pitrilysin family protein [Priestia taiwanensis]MBM7362779.1 putative Zn-dependent peptidase [Priestia taiwanensis]GGE65025.1 peptidase M16 [Priestia taiwanensis]
MKFMEEHTKALTGITLHTIPTKKYKTNTFVLRLKAPLQEDTVSLRALLPYVLQSATKSLASTREVRQYLEEMYGASLSVDVGKKGDYHVMSFYMDIVNEKYLQDTTPLFEKALALLSEVLLQPLVEGDGFSTSIVENEKRSLVQRIQSVFDDKLRYANERLMEEMCKNEVYQLNANGKVADVQKIDNKMLYTYYKQMLESDCKDIYIIGDVEESDCIEMVNKYFTLPSCATVTNEKKTESIKVEEKEIIEKQDIHQGKLHIGYRTHTSYCDQDYYALQVFNGIFGGFSHSKLFINVREKNSLAYYAASRYESHKGLLMVMAGIEAENYEKAVTIIKEQMQAMKDGDFTDQEITQTKAVIRNQLLESIDTSRGTIEMMYHNVVAGCERPMSEWVANVEKVTKDEIVAVANKVELDTIYFLKGTEGK